jgi:small subunit ribosomal protein S3
MDVRSLVNKQMGRAGIAEIEIERFPRQLNVTIHTARPGIIIGKKGAAVTALRDELGELTEKTVRVDVAEVKAPEVDAVLIADSIAYQLEHRISHRRATKQAALKAMRAGAEGVKVVVGGRLGGADMARRDSVIMGRVPRQTLRANVNYAQAEALTTYGRIGIKVWVYLGEVLPGDEPAALSGEGVGL